tara:strand:+ start:10059 stop:11330 length:1272 start_codon:yes stop_codon:yes gene_type:complete
MKFLLHFSRLFVGNLFIFSGIVKANDPLGFSYKLIEYFEEFGTNWEWLLEIAMPLAAAICILEIVLGVAVLVGYKMKQVSWVLLAMILFFTVLTFASAVFEIVRSCGCFGDAIPLTPWESFYKDLILLALILILFVKRNVIEPFTELKPAIIYVVTSVVVMGVLSNQLNWNFPLILTGIVLGGSLIMFVINKNQYAMVAVVVSLISSTVFSVNCVRHLPQMDFRPYAEGKNIAEQMELPENAIQPEYENILTYKNKTTGEEKDFTQENYPWDDDNWEWVSTESKLIKEGDVAKITDFSIEDESGNDITYSILDEELVFLVIMYDLGKADVDKIGAINEIAKKAEANLIPFVALTAATAEFSEEFRHQYQTPFPFYTTDGIVLKTIVRSNPGLVLLRKGTIVAKWHSNDLPSYEEISSKYSLDK